MHTKLNQIVIEFILVYNYSIETNVFNVKYQIMNSTEFNVA